MKFSLVASSLASITSNSASGPQAYCLEQLPAANVAYLKPQQSMPSSSIALSCLSSSPKSLPFPTKRHPKTKSLFEKLQAANMEGKHKVPPQSTASQNARHLTIPSTSTLNTFSTEIRILLYDEYFKITAHDSQTPPLVIALRCVPALYEEMLERYYHTCQFVLSAFNLLDLQENVSIKVMRSIRHLTVRSRSVLPSPTL